MTTDAQGWLLVALFCACIAGQLTLDRIVRAVEGFFAAPVQDECCECEEDPYEETGCPVG